MVQAREEPAPYVRPARGATLLIEAVMLCATEDDARDLCTIEAVVLRATEGDAPDLCMSLTLPLDCKAMIERFCFAPKNVNPD